MNKATTAKRFPGARTSTQVVAATIEEVVTAIRLEAERCDLGMSWLTELLRRRGWGMKVLGRTMGLANEAAVGRKANGKEWIYPTEQVRMSRQIKRILSGELVCIPGKPGRVKDGGYAAGKAVLAAHPVPLVPPYKQVLDVDHLLKRGVGRLKLVPAYPEPALRLPDFEALRKALFAPAMLSRTR